MRLCYHDKWVLGRTDVTLHASLPQASEALIYVSFLCFPLSLQEVVIHQGRLELTQETLSGWLLLVSSEEYASRTGEETTREPGYLWQA